LTVDETAVTTGPTMPTRTSLSVLIVAATLAVACQKQAAPEPGLNTGAPGTPPAAPAAPAAATPGPTGSARITGSVKLTGAAPEMALTKRQADPFCAKTPMKDEEVVVGAGGGLKNVMVRISKGITGRYDAPAEAAVLDQTACMYRPRVQGIVAGQTLVIKNSDQTLHNVHGYKGPSTLFNQAEIPGLPPITKKLTDVDQVVKFKCDVHPWMTGYVLVSSHPFFAVTTDDGKFEISRVPPGKYTLEAWHERYGAKTSDITVAADKPTEVAFQYESR
jgi:plastocyanin